MKVDKERALGKIHLAVAKLVVKQVEGERKQVNRQRAQNEINRMAERADVRLQRAIAKNNPAQQARGASELRKWQRRAERWVVEFKQS